MKKFQLAYLTVLVAGLAEAQLQPVLLDADDLAIGPVVSIDAISGLNEEYVALVSQQGYRAKMVYLPGDPDSAAEEGFDYPGLRASRFYDSQDCSGDPVMWPSLSARRNFVTDTDDIAAANRVRQLARLEYTGVRRFQLGDMLESGGVTFYVPLSADTVSFEPKSFRSRPESGCLAVDRCDVTQWGTYPHLLSFSTDADRCPWNEDEPGPVESPVFSVGGFPFSALVENDAQVTGFESIAYKPPYRIRYVQMHAMGDPGLLSWDQGVNGLFYDSTNPGHGFDFNVHEKGLTVFYYGHRDSGERLWLISDVFPDDLMYDTEIVLDMYEVIDGQFGEPSHDPATLWGTLTVVLDDCNNGSALLEGDDGVVEMPVERLARLKNILCH